MGNKSKTKKIIPAIIIVALFFTQISFPNETFGADKLNWNNPTKGGAPAFKFNTENVSSTMIQVIGCTKILENMAKKVGSVAQNIAKAKAEKIARKAASKASKGAGVAAATTSVNAPGGTQAGKDISDWLKNLLSDIYPTKTTDPDLKEQNAAAIARNECLNGVAINLAKRQLVEMTRTTMQWVNTGFNGDPLYVRNMNKLMNTVEKNVIEAELSLFKDPNIIYSYPYGRGYVKSAIYAQNAKDDFLTHMISDLSIFLDFKNKEVFPNKNGYIESYAEDFSLGGWTGWLALTQKPQNNPLGNTLEMTKYINEKVETEKKEIEKEVEANGGMLSDKKCFEWKPDTTQTIINNDGTTEEKTIPIDKNNPENCTLWEVVTPGSLIRDKVSAHLNSDIHQAEMVKTVNDMLFGLFSSLLNNLQSGGLASLNPKATTSNFNSSDFFNEIEDNKDGYKESIYEKYGGSWAKGERFDITKDIPIVIQVQKDFIEQANIYIKKYLERISSLGELDYCIPGPNASWKENMVDAKDAYTDYVESIFPKDIALPGDDNNYTIIVPAMRDSYEKIMQKSDLFPIIKISPFFYIIRERIGTTFKEFGIKARSDFWSTYVQNIEKEYVKKIDNTYGPNSPMQTPYKIDENGNILGENTSYLPMAKIGLSLTKNLKEEGEELETVQKDHKEEITQINTNIYRLEKIKNEIDALIKKANKARSEARKEAGLDPISNSCLLKEEVSYLGNE